MRPFRPSALRPTLALVFALACAAPPSAQRPASKVAPAPKIEPASKAKPTADAAPAQKSVPVAGLRGAPSAAPENEAGESDPAFDFTTKLKRGRTMPSGKTGSGASSSRLRVADHPKRADLARAIEDALRDREIDVALLGGHKYMINDCLGIKASAGEFRLKLANPKIAFENSGIVLTFAIDHVALSAIKLRMRPNPNVLELCRFSKKFEVGGAMEDVRLTLRFDPLYDMELCRIGSWGDANPEVRIGNLNLKPLQNDLDRMAKDMVEDALTLGLQMAIDGTMSALGDLVFSAIDRFLEADCPTKAGESGRAIAGVRGALGGATGSAGRSGSATSGSASGAAASAPADVQALQARIAELEARIAELEGRGDRPSDLEGLLSAVIEQLTTLDAHSVGPRTSELLVQLLALAFERSAGDDPRAFVEQLAGMTDGTKSAESTPAQPPGASAPAAPWFLVPNPELKGRMGRVVVRFPDAELGKSTHVALHRDGKKVADVYGEAAWELLPGVHEVLVTYASVPGCEVRAGHDTVVRTGMLTVEVASQTHFTLFPKGGKAKLHDQYGSGALGLPIGEYEVEIQGQRELVTIREGEITRF